MLLVQSMANSYSDFFRFLIRANSCHSWQFSFRGIRGKTYPCYSVQSVANKKKSAKIVFTDTVR